MQGSLSASREEIGWVLTSYIVSVAITMPLAGWLAGRVGIKYIYLYSVIGFTVASALCGAATSLPELVIFRVLQGVGGAALVPLAQATLLSINPPERHGQAMAVFGTGTILGPIAGPMLGGWLTDAFGWRSVFYVNVPVGIISALGIAIFVRDNRRAHREAFDFFGFATLSVAIGAFQLMLDRGAVHDWFASPEIWIEATLAGLALYLLVVHTATTHRAVVSQPRPAAQFAVRRRHGAGLLYRHYDERDAGIVAADAGAADGIPGADHRAGDRAARHRHDDRHVRRGPTDKPGRCSRAAYGRVVPDRRLMLADDGVLASDGGRAGDRLRFDPRVRVRLHRRAAQPDRAVQPAATHPDAGTAIRGLMRNLGGSTGIPILLAQLTANTQIVHSRLIEQLRPDNPLAQPPLLSSQFSLSEPSGVAALNHEITRQASMVAYIDDFKLMMFVSLASIPLILLLRRPRPPAPSQPPPISPTMARHEVEQ